MTTQEYAHRRKLHYKAFVADTQQLNNGNKMGVYVDLQSRDKRVIHVFHSIRYDKTTDLMGKATWGSYSGLYRKCKASFSWEAIATVWLKFRISLPPTA